MTHFIKSSYALQADQSTALRHLPSKANVTICHLPELGMVSPELEPQETRRATATALSPAEETADLVRVSHRANSPLKNMRAGYRF